MKTTNLTKKAVNFFGFESIDSSGKHHNHPAVIRGLGELTLTNQGIRFKQWITNKEYDIPLEMITKVETKSWQT